MNNNPETSNRKRKSSDMNSQELSNNSSEEARPEPSEETTVICQRCHHAVPEGNRIVHEVNCARRVRANEEFFQEATGTGHGAAVEPPPQHFSIRDENESENLRRVRANQEFFDQVDAAGGAIMGLPDTESVSDLELYQQLSDEPVSELVDLPDEPAASESIPVASVINESIRPPSRNFPFPRSRPDSQREDSQASHHNLEIARSLANVMVDDAREENDVQQQARQPYSNSLQANSTNPSSTVAASAAPNANSEAEWACPRCTLLNPSSFSHCDACLYPRHGIRSHTNAFSPSRPPDAIQTTRLIGDPFVSDMSHGPEEDWVNISRANPTATPNNNRSRDDGFIISDTPQQRLSTGYRIFNSALNGAMIGSIVGGVTGLIVGGLAGGIGGAWVSTVRNREADRDMNEAEEALGQNAQGTTTSRNGVRVHRGRNYIIAVRSDENGRRILRLRHNGSRPTGDSTNEQNNAIMEQALSDMLLRMSYMNGLRPRGNFVIQPNLSYEELLEMYGNGDENRRGASEEVINSYPIEMVGRETDTVEFKKKMEEKTESSNPNETSDKKVDFGTCGICLEDYQYGEWKKSLSCPHSFHRECIDRWLKQVASCPICKKEVVEKHQAEKKEGTCSSTTE